MSEAFDQIMLGLIRHGRNDIGRWDQKSGRWARLIDAASFAMTIYAEPLRKGSETPYISHLLRAASLVLELGGDEDQAIAGLLHDAIEDQGAEQEPFIEERFGARGGNLARLQRFR